METKIFKSSNPIVDAYKEGKPAVALEVNKNNQYRLTRFRKKFNAIATGKEINNRYVVVFWENLK